MSIPIKVIKCPDEVINFGGFTAFGHVDKGMFAVAVAEKLQGATIDTEAVEHGYACKECGFLNSTDVDEHRANQRENYDCTTTPMTAWHVVLEDPATGRGVV